MQKAGMKVQCIDTDSGTDRDQMSEADSSYERLKTFNKIITDITQPHDIFSDKIDYTKEKFLLIVGSRHVPDINFTDRNSRVEGILSQVKKHVPNINCIYTYDYTKEQSEQSTHSMYSHNLKFATGFSLEDFLEEQIDGENYNIFSKAISDGSRGIFIVDNLQKINMQNECAKYYAAEYNSDDISTLYKKLYICQQTTGK